VCSSDLIKDLIATSVDRTGAGAAMVRQAGSTMERVVASVQEVNALIADITHASQQQGAGIVRINGAVGELDQMTQQNAALVDQSAAAAKSLEDQAQRLTLAVQCFKLSDERRLRFA
jgi:methyl-accepting chemotaxis protein